jgi:hypothetical protein
VLFCSVTTVAELYAGATLATGNAKHYPMTDIQPMVVPAE